MGHEVIMKVPPLLRATAIARGGRMDLGPVSRDLADILWQQLSISLGLDPAAVEHSSFDTRSQP